MKDTETDFIEHDFTIGQTTYDCAFWAEITVDEGEFEHEPGYREHERAIGIEVVDISARIGSAEIYDKHTLRLLRNQAQEWANAHSDELAFKAGL